MASYNKAIIVGNITRDPELKFAKSGTAICMVGIASTHTYGSGENKKEDTLFLDVTFFGQKAEFVGKYLKKGASILVEGRLSMDTWEDKNTGQKRSKIGLVADTVQSLERRQSGQPQDTNTTERTEKQNMNEPVPF